MQFLKIGLGASLAIAYATLLFGGFDFTTHEKKEVPSSVRQSPGGYRSWSFWHSGSHGGK
ncbi:MAG: hypothetical protein ABIP39_03695 [Polyangiaceae bacterium]